MTSSSQQGTTSTRSNSHTMPAPTIQRPIPPPAAANQQQQQQQQQEEEQSSSSAANDEVTAMLLPSLYRLTEGLPRKELKLMVSEAMICEEALENEIRQLQEALHKSTTASSSSAGGDSSSSAIITPSVQLMLDTEFTPPDRCFTVSALLGRLRDDLATPLPPGSILPALRAQSGLTPPPPKKKKKETHNTTTRSASTEPTPPRTGTTGAAAGAASAASTSRSNISTPSLEKQKKILALYQNPEYTREHLQPNSLLALWKKISSHRSSIVFRRPVNPKEAPGYSDRIDFPMDLSLIRKMIVARHIQSYSELHQRLGLICHNCVKYNGRESDYGVVTREFESNADEMMLTAVRLAAANAGQPPQQQQQQEATTSATTPRGSQNISPTPQQPHPPSSQGAAATQPRAPPPASTAAAAAVAMVVASSSAAPPQTALLSSSSAGGAAASSMSVVKNTTTAATTTQGTPAAKSIAPAPARAATDNKTTAVATSDETKKKEEPDNPPSTAAST